MICIFCILYLYSCLIALLNSHVQIAPFLSCHVKLQPNQSINNPKSLSCVCVCLCESVLCFLALCMIWRYVCYHVNNQSHPPVLAFDMRSHKQPFPMSITWVSHVATIVLMRRWTLLNQSHPNDRIYIQPELSWVKTFQRSKSGCSRQQLN